MFINIISSTDFIRDTSCQIINENVNLQRSFDAQSWINHPLSLTRYGIILRSRSCLVNTALRMSELGHLDGGDMIGFKVLPPFKPIVYSLRQLIT